MLLYGGVGRVAEAFADKGVPAAVFDLSVDARNDLTSPPVQRAILQYLEKHRVKGVGIDIVCSTWSRARRAPEWSCMPHALRGSSGHAL